jgi:hypothetical protein
MTRPILMLALAACLAAACGQSNSPQSAPAGQAAPAAGPAGQPQTPESTPAATPEARPTGTSAPASNPAAPPSTSTAARPSSASSSEPPAPPAPPPAPKFRELTVPAGTSLSVTVLSTLASNTSKVEDPVKGSLAKPVTVSGFTAIPSGAQISGNVTDAKESGRVKGKATIAFRFNRLVVSDEAIPIRTAQVTRVAAQDTAGDVKKGGLGAGAGAIVGGVIGGGKGAAIGAVAGGAGAVLGTKGKEVQVEPGTVVSVLLQEPITVQVPIR